MKVTLELPDWVDAIGITTVGMTNIGCGVRVNIKDGDNLTFPEDKEAEE